MGDYSRDQMLDDLRALRMRQPDFAAATGYSAQSVYHWGSHVPMPRWVGLLLAAWVENKRLKER